MTNRSLWVSILERIKPTISRANFVTWMQNTSILNILDGVVTVGVPSVYAFDWLSKKYHVKILQAAQEVQEDVVDVQYEISDLLAHNGEGVDVKELMKSEDKKVRKVRNVNEVKVTKGGGHISSRILNFKYTLDNFIIGNDNRLPHAASKAVSREPGGIYNPLYVYGKVGLGKTHLLQAIGNEVLNYFPDKVVKYITAERFVTEVVHAIGNRNTKQFKEQYRNVDVLLLDDVQFFARKDSSQQEFFHTFNELYNHNKQIVITSDRSPSELDGLDSRLTSRFGMGMVVELLFPDYETRLAILHQKCKEFEVIMDPEVLNFIANNVHNSVRELEGVLRQAVAEAQLENRMPTIRSVAGIIRRLNKAQEIIGYDIDAKNSAKIIKNEVEVLKIVADYYNVNTEALVGKDRHKEVMVPRQVCMYLIKNELGYSYERIGEGFGGRNHTTVMHACNKTSRRLKTDVRLVRDVNAIKKEMGL